MTPAVRELLQRDTFSPYRLANIAARYDLSQLNSLVYDGSNRVQLVGDLSGNSAVNGLVLTGGNSNYASTPHSAANDITGNIEFVVQLAAASWASGVVQVLMGKNAPNTPAGESYVFYLTALGKPTMTISDGATESNPVSTLAVPFANFSTGWIKANWNVAGTAKFYTSTDGVNWTQLGTDVSATARSPQSKAVILEIGSRTAGVAPFTGIIYRAQLYNGINGTLAFDANFATVSKLAASFTESSSNAATVTINTSGRFGARICGARDRVNMTVAEQPVLTIASGGNYLTYDGSNDCLASAPFPYAQPESVYFVGSIITQGGNRVFYDGLASAEVMECFSLVTSTLISITGGPSVVSTSVLATSVRAVIRSLFQGTTSSVGLNLISAVSGTIGSTSAANGIIVGARSSIAAFGNITESELILRSAADSAPLQARIAAYMIRKWRVTLP
ncbi:hypothetical protein UFOVP1007_15 [uncultured Caudovirales phage]|uniref:Uncharacterized protein n=1 Tax=uncultured Caudovirales phage TaxID=2100421 RepID=A0A6J5QXY5_9CAUD|nr:hypothetical protein UFOVP927_48 [uncultured Caudovirales phage]CAB4178032.1 hypothetical protein UFOVP1007_15 [uncultured Caudovirales phage]CAB4187296.1 hypothetical protein UFOVP1159_15 [uncultured Caudovirales phage]